MSRMLRSLSAISAGRGVGLKNTGPVAAGRAVQLGRSPGPGTGCSVMLFTNFDTAYESAVLSFYVQQFGRRSLFAQITIAPQTRYRSCTGCRLFEADIEDFDVQQ